MQITMLLFDDLAVQDAIGPYEVFRNVPGWQIDIAAPRRGELRARGGLGLLADRALDEVDSTDLLLIPGGRGVRKLMRDEDVLSRVRDIDRATKWTTSVCTGALLLGAAGLLEGRRATTNWLALEEIRELGAEPVGGRFVEDGKLLTAAGVTAGIDMALHLVARETAPQVAEAVQLGIEYDPDPPFDSGSPQKASPGVVELVEAAARQSESLD